MSMFVLPLRTEFTHYSFVQTYDGISYNFELHYNTREEAWYLDLRLEDGTDIRTGIKVVVDFPLAKRSKHEKMLPGMLVCFDSSGKRLDPTIDDLGSRIRMLYFDESETESLKAEIS